MGDVFTALRPIYFLFKLLGLATISVGGVPGNRIVSRIKSNSPYKAAFYLFIVLVVTCGVLNNCLLKPDYLMNDLNAYVHVFKMYLILIYLILLAICNEIRSSTLGKVWLDLMHMDELMNHHLHVKMNNNAVRIYSLKLVAFAFLLIILMNICEGFITRSYVSVIMFCLFDVYKCSGELSLHIYTRVLKSRFQKLDESLAALEVDASDFLVREVAAIHVGLLEATELVGGIFSLSNLLNAGLNFILVVSKAHTLCTVLFFHSRMPAGFISAVVAYMIFYSVCWVATIASVTTFTKQVDELKLTLFKLGSRVRSSALRKEINGFSLQLLHYHVRVTAGGFFNLDFSLIYAMVGAISTYLITLVQFDIILLQQSE